MLNFLYARTKTPLQRACLVLIACVLVLSALAATAGAVWQVRLVALAPAWMAVILIMRCSRRWTMAKYGLMRTEMRMVKSWRRYSKKPPIVEALHLLGLGVAMLSLAAALAAGLYEDASLVMAPAFAVLTVAGVCEITVQTKRILKQAWAQTAGKILSLSFGVALAAVTVAMAKQTVHSLAHIDPKYMTEFTAVVAAALLPIVYLGAASALLAIWACFQILLLGAVLFGGSFLAQAKPLIGERTENRVRLFWFRIRNGRRPQGGKMPNAAFMPQHEVSLVGSVLSKLAVVVCFAQVLQGVATEVPAASPLLTKTMVDLEYRPESGCRNIGADLGVVYMDDGNVSVARIQDGRYAFTVEKCEYGSGT